MDTGRIAKNMIKFNKTAFENTFHAMTILQEQTERTIGYRLQQAPLLPAEAKTAISDWLGAYRKGREDFKAAMDESYKKVEDFFIGYEKAKEA
jgi:hypothetical protein